LHPFALQRLAGSLLEWAVMLTPVVLYLLYLGMGVNRRKHPVVVRGGRDFLGLLFAAAGFLLVGPFSWIAHLFRPQGVTAYWTGYSIYVIGLAFLSLSAYVRRCRTLVIYNIEPTVCAEVIQFVLAELKIEYTATPGRIAFHGGRLLLDIETSFLFNNVSLRWRGEDRTLAMNIEPRLIQELQSVESERHAAGIILTLAAMVLLIFIAFALGMWWLAWL
jgi:hypothetical protein